MHDTAPDRVRWWVVYALLLVNFVCDRIDTIATHEIQRHQGDDLYTLKVIATRTLHWVSDTHPKRRGEKPGVPGCPACFELYGGKWGAKNE